MTQAIFIFFAVLAIISAILVIAQKNPMHSVLYLTFTVLSVSGLFFTMQADFLGAIQIMVYAGGIVVLYVFIIIIINLNQLIHGKRKFFPGLFIVSIPVLLIIEIIYVLNNKFNPGVVIETRPDNMKFEALAQMLFVDYLIPFEVASVLLLAVLVGSIIIARKGYEK